MKDPDYREIGKRDRRQVGRTEGESGIIDSTSKIAIVKVIFLALENFYRRYLHEKCYNDDGDTRVA